MWRKARPWCNGSGMTTASCSESSRKSRVNSAAASQLAWECITPFGVPVEPLVYVIDAMSSGAPLGGNGTMLPSSDSRTASNDSTAIASSPESSNVRSRTRISLTLPRASRISSRRSATLRSTISAAGRASARIRAKATGGMPV